MPFCLQMSPKGKKQVDAYNENEENDEEMCVKDEIITDVKP